jgi:hypothetical protein
LIKDYLNIGNIEHDVSRYDSYKHILRKNTNKFSLPFDQILNDTITESKSKNPQHSWMIWNLTNNLSMVLSTLRLNLSVNIWRSIFYNTLRYDGVIDPGLGLIFDMEPSQSVFFNPKDLELLHILKNRTKTYKLNTTFEDIQKMSNDSFMNIFSQLNSFGHLFSILKTNKIDSDFIFNDPQQLHEILLRVLNNNPETISYDSWIAKIIRKQYPSVTQLRIKFPEFLETKIEPLIKTRL